jgi:hypothetical protein
MTELELLAKQNPEDVFPNNADEAKSLYHKLARVFHPDQNFGRDAAFKHLVDLHTRAQALIAAGIWESRDSVQLALRDGKQIKWHFLEKKAFELGTLYICKEHAIYVVDSQHKKLVDNAVAVHDNFQFASNIMRTEFEKYLPAPPTVFEAADGRFIVRYKKPEEYVLLSDVIKHYGQMDVRHTNWVMNSLFNMGCYLSYTRIVHNNISPESFFISPSNHSCLLLGWWYCKPQDSTIEAVPKRTFNILPWDVRQKKKAIPTIDLECIRSIGRELLGDATGRHYTVRVDDAVGKWLREIANESAVNHYKSWSKLIERIFGPRKFVAMNLTQNELYANNKR